MNIDNMRMSFFYWKSVILHSTCGLQVICMPDIIVGSPLKAFIHLQITRTYNCRRFKSSIIVHSKIQLFEKIHHLVKQINLLCSYFLHCEFTVCHWCFKTSCCSHKICKIVNISIIVHHWCLPHTMDLLRKSSLWIVFLQSC